jgi:Raf kinase inhibitor-like YbhB/YbcL family protein
MNIVLDASRSPALWSSMMTLIVAFLGLSGCSSQTTGTGGGKMTIHITSSAFEHGRPIPKEYTGEGADVSPPLAWTDLPEKTKELVLICDDPDAPSPKPWVHWVMYKIPPTLKGLPAGIPRTPRLKEPAGALQGMNSWLSGSNIGYRGPLPPSGSVHRYFFRLYALDARVVLEPGLSKETVLDEIRDHVLATGELIGTYVR